MTPTITLPIVGLSGYARTGKDTAARALITEGFTQREFKGALTAFCHALNPLLPDGRRWAAVYDEIGYEASKDTVPGFVETLIDAGQAARNTLYENVWVDSALRDIDGQRVVITDCRFPNEARAIRARRGVVVRITRPGVGPLVRADGSISEADLALEQIEPDLVIDNSGTEADLHSALLAGLRQIGQDRPPALADTRDPECVKAWPGCFPFGYDPRCCRFPKSCSC